MIPGGRRRKLEKRELFSLRIVTSSFASGASGCNLLLMFADVRSGHLEAVVDDGRFHRMGI